MQLHQLKVNSQVKLKTWHITIRHLNEFSCYFIVMRVLNPVYVPIVRITILTS
jgi:hypothetical protein